MIDGLDTVSRLKSESFVLVSPNRNQICTAYPPAAEQIYKDSKIWIRTPPFSDTFAFFGRSLLTEDGEDWARHRKIVAPAFNEQTMRSVWEEAAVRTTKDLDLAVDGTTRYNLQQLRDNCMILAMHVLITVGFGQDIGAVTKRTSGHKLTLMESLDFILRNIVSAILFSGLTVPDLFLPSSLRMLKLSVAELRRYMQESVFQQMRDSSSSRGAKAANSKPSLLEAMVNANESEKSQSNTFSKPSFLTDSELYGNLFAFKVAGFETTGASLTYAIPYLALYPDLQDWLVDEIDAHFSAGNKGYHETFPKLVRCQAFLYETMRLSGPAAQMLRSPTVETTLTIAPGKTISVDTQTMVAGHFYALHTSPRWGSDAGQFNPRRFIRDYSTTHHHLPGDQGPPPPGREEFTATPVDDPSFDGAMFVAWLTGPHVCIGKKFSIVEFVAVIATLLSSCRVELDPEVGVGTRTDVKNLNLKPGTEIETEAEAEEEQSREAARKRMMAVLDDKYFNIGVHLRRPRDAGVRFVRRHDEKGE